MVCVPTSHLLGNKKFYHFNGTRKNWEKKFQCFVGKKNLTGSILPFGLFLILLLSMSNTVKTSLYIKQCLRRSLVCKIRQFPRCWIVYFEAVFTRYPVTGHFLLYIWSFTNLFQHMINTLVVRMAVFVYTIAIASVNLCFWSMPIKVYYSMPDSNALKLSKISDTSYKRSLQHQIHYGIWEICEIIVKPSMMRWKTS